jgi:hypothetical protein
MAAMDRAEPRSKSVQWLLDPDIQYAPDLGQREEAEEPQRSRLRFYPIALAASAAVIIGGAAYLALPLLQAELFDSEPQTSPVALNDAPVLTVGPLNSGPQSPAPSLSEPPAPAPAQLPPQRATAPPHPAVVVLSHPAAIVTPPPAAESAAKPVLLAASPPPPSPVRPHPVLVALAMPLPHPVEVQPATLPETAPAWHPPAPPSPPAAVAAVAPIAAVPPASPATTPAPLPHPAVSQVPAVRAVAAAPRIVRAANLHFNVRLSFTTNEAARAASFAHALRQQGFTVTSIAVSATFGRWPGVAFFYESDRDKARLIARQLTALTGIYQHARLSPRHPYAGPGTVEVSLLGDAKPKTRGPDRQARTKRLS